MYREIWQELKDRQEMQKQAGIQDMIARLLGQAPKKKNILAKLLPALLAGGGGAAYALSPDVRSGVNSAASSVGNSVSGLFNQLFGGGGASSGGGGGSLASGIMDRLSAGKPRVKPDSTEKGLRNDLRQSYKQEDVQGIGDAQSALAAFLGGTSGVSSARVSNRSKRKLNKDPFRDDGAWKKPRGEAGGRQLTPDLQSLREQLSAMIGKAKPNDPARAEMIAKIKQIDSVLGPRLGGQTSSISRSPQGWASQIRGKEENRLGPIGTKEQDQTINELINMFTGGGKSPRPTKPDNLLERDPMAWLQSITGKEENRLGPIGSKDQAQTIQQILNMLTGGK